MYFPEERTFSMLVPLKQLIRFHSVCHLSGKSNTSRDFMLTSSVCDCSLYLLNVLDVLASCPDSTNQEEDKDKNLCKVQRHVCEEVSVGKDIIKVDSIGLDNPARPKR